MVKPVTTYVTNEYLLGYGHVMRRQQCCKGSNNNESWRGEILRKVQIDMDGQPEK